MTDRVGQQLGNYQLLRLLGEGGFAEVYLGEHIHLGTQAAIKVLHTQLTSDDVDKFRTEARTIARLIHPHIVRVLEFGVEGKTPFLVMDYAPNGTLRQKHPKCIALPLPLIVAYVKQVADALQYAHDEKLIHRDIKPENILLGRRNDILLSDFGIALVAQSSRYQSAQEMAGTMAYMAPEQIQGHPRPASDQYSLGVVVYEWLSGDRPFHGSLTELVGQHLSVPPPSLQEKVSMISSEVDQVVLIALAKDPKKRFGSIQAFATALEQACQVAPLSPIALQSEVISPSQLSLSTHTVAAIPPSQLSQPMNMVTPLSQSLEPMYVFTPPDQQLQNLIVAKPSDIPIVPPPSVREFVVSGNHQLFQPSKHRISRRAIVMGLVGLTGVSVVGGGLAWLTRSQKPQVSSLVPHSPITPTPASTPTPTPTPSPIGTTFYTYSGHSDIVETVAWSPDGTRIASGGQDKTVQVWNAIDGSHVFTYRGHSGVVFRAVWSSDGKRIASSAGDGIVKIWDAVDGGHVYTHPNGVSPKKVVIGSNTFYENIVGSVAWSPDGTSIVSVNYDGGFVQVWDPVDGHQISTYQGVSESNAAWSLNGTRIAFGIDPNIVQIWNTVDGSHVYTYPGHSSVVYAVVWSLDGTRIASGSWDKTVQVWGAVDGGHVYTYRGHSDIVDAIALSPDGRRIASASYDKTVKVWQAF